MLPRAQSLSAILVSLCIHLSLLVGMALFLIGGSGQEGTGIRLLVDSSQESLTNELTHLELSSSIASDASQEEMSKTPDVQDSVASTTLTSLPASPTPLAFDGGLLVSSAPSGVFGEATAAAMAAGKKSILPEKEPGYGQGASFFGTYAPGQRFIFVIDSSQSMLEGSRWGTLRRELLRAIKGLSVDQEFFVISFDIGAHPMFDLYPPTGSFLPPTDQSIYRLNTWLNSINHGGATLPASSIGLALRLKPDAIFLLSDGEIQDRTVEELRFYNRVKQEDGSVSVSIPIHTVLLHSPIGAATLKVIADENDGVFTPVKVPPARP